MVFLFGGNIMTDTQNFINRQEIIDTARMLKDKHVRYSLGAKAVPPAIPKELDCSGFVRYCYLAAGIAVPDGSWHQWHVSEPIDKSQLEIADLGFLYDPNKNSEINHIGLYFGAGKWIHCSFSAKGVTVDDGKVFKYFRRFINLSKVPEKHLDSSPNPPKWMITVTEKEKQYAVDSIYVLADLGYILNPSVHIKNLYDSPENWAQWVVLANMAKEFGKKQS